MRRSEMLASSLSAYLAGWLAASGGRLGWLGLAGPGWLGLEAISELTDLSNSLFKSKK